MKYICTVYGALLTKHNKKLLRSKKGEKNMLAMAMAEGRERKKQTPENCKK